MAPAVAATPINRPTAKTADIINRTLFLCIANPLCDLHRRQALFESAGIIACFLNNNNRAPGCKQRLCIFISEFYREAIPHAPLVFLNLIKRQLSCPCLIIIDLVKTAYLKKNRAL